MHSYMILIIFTLLFVVAVSGCTTDETNYINTNISLCVHENGSVANRVPCKIVENVYVLGGTSFNPIFGVSDEMGINDSANIYGIVDMDKIILVEAGGRMSFDPLVKSLDELGFGIEDVEAVLLTHEHYDHAYNSWKFQDLGIPIYAHKEVAECIESDPVCPEVIIEYPSVKLAKKLRDDEIIKFKEKSIKVIHVAGHTPGSVFYLLTSGGKKIAFSGDVCFFDGIIRNSSICSPGCIGTNEEHIESLKKLTSFRIDIILDGHSGYDGLFAIGGDDHFRSCLECVQCYKRT